MRLKLICLTIVGVILVMVRVYLLVSQVEEKVNKLVSRASLISDEH